MDVKDNPGDYIKRTGPNNDEAKVIEAMVKDGATFEDLYRKFPDIVRVALRRWHVSVLKGPEAALKVEADELEEARDAKEAAAAAKKIAEKTVSDANAEAKRILDAAKAEAAKLLADTKSGKKKDDPLA